MSTRAPFAVLALLPLCGSCVGAIEGGRERPEGAPVGADATDPLQASQDRRPPPAAAPSAPAPAGPGAAPAGPSAAGPAPGACARASAVPTMPVRRLTEEEYENTVRDLVGSLPAGLDLPPDGHLGHFPSNAANAVTELFASQYADAAARIAPLVLPRLERSGPCDTKAKGEESCAATHVRVFGRRAYRRPLLDSEQAGLIAVYRTQRGEGATYPEALKVVFEAMLQSPHFLYHVERGRPAPGEVAPLTGHEVASRLSYLFWRSMPDDALLAAAEAGTLATAEGVQAEARRLLDDPRAQGGFRAFLRAWLEVDRLERGDTDEDAAVFEAFTPALKKAMGAELDRLLIDSVRAPGDTVEALLLTRDAFVDEPLARLYGIPGPKGGPARVTLPESDRAGLLTRAGLLAVLSYSDQTSPVHRGVFVRERLLCQELPAPPPDVVVSVPKIDAGATARQRFAEHSRSPACAGCHQLMDPIGLGFERYDAIGALRTREADGSPVDATGLIVAAGRLDGSFDGVVDLSKKLAGDAQVRACLAAEWLAFSSGSASESAAEGACRSGAAAAALEAGGNSLPRLALALVRTDGFRMLRRPAQETCP